MIKSLVIVYSYHHMNTEKVGNVIADVLDAQLKYPENINSMKLKDYDLIGFGAGIDSGKHYEPILKFAKSLEYVKNKKAFIFSTSAILGDKKIANDHSALREILISKGYIIIDEFACKGFNTNSFLKYIGGLNKQRPNDNDLNEAKIFAQNLNKFF